MKIIISGHAKRRMEAYNLTEKLVKDAVIKPDEIVEGYAGALVAQKLLNEHLLRVVYIKQDKEIKVITVYPAEKTRYWRGK